MKSVSIVIPNYNGRHLLEKNLPAVVAAASHFKDKTHIDVEIIISDDGSTDDSLSAVTQLSTPIPVKLVKNEKNLGFSSTVNRGVSKAESEIIVLLNTDVRPEEDFLPVLVKHFDDANVFAVGCLDKSIEGKKIILRGRGIGKWQRGTLVHARGEVDKTNTLWVSGGSGAFRKAMWKRLGGLNTLYDPFYWEDIDLSYRALKSGYAILFEPKSIVTHEHEEGAVKKHYTELQIKTVAYRNQFIFVWENATDFDLQLTHFFWLPYHLVKALLRFDIAFFLGFMQALLCLPQVISTSSKAQKLFVKTDKEIVNQFIG